MLKQQIPIKPDQIPLEQQVDEYFVLLNYGNDESPLYDLEAGALIHYSILIL